VATLSKNTKDFVVAPKAAMRDQVPANWRQQLAQTPGVKLVGSSFDRLQLQATDEVAQDLTKKLGDYLNIEEAAPRRTD
jgi:hypothetical protein